MSTFGDKVYELGGVPMGGKFQTEPNSTVFLKASGNDSSNGKAPERPVLTLDRAHTLLPADKNGVAYLVSESNSAGSTTIRITAATQTWSKDGTHLIGVASGGQIGSRARIGNTADAANVTPLLSWTADNSSMQNIHLFYGEADAGDLGAMDVTGERNYFYNNHIAGIGDTTQDVDGAYSIKVSGSENLFEKCTFGVDTVARNNSTNNNYVMELTGVRNIFRDCLFLAHPTDAAAMFVEVTGSGGRWNMFERCTFIANPDIGGYTEPTAVFDHKATASSILLKDCTVLGVTDWATGTGAAQVYIDGDTGVNSTDGIAVTSTAT